MSITLNRNEVDYELQAALAVWPLIVQATSDEAGLPSEIFVYHVLPVNNDLDEVFECVASLPQMSEIGLTIADGVPYYRKDNLRIDCRTVSEADRIWELIQTDTRSLLWGFRYAEGLELSEEVVIA